MSLAFANNLRRFAPKGLAQQAARALSTAVAHEPFFAHDKLGGRSSWNGKQLVESEWWGKQLSEEHLAELHEATHACMSSGQLEYDGDVALGVSKENFPLGNTAELLAAMSDELENGTGVSMLQGIQVDNYSLKELGVMYLGMCSHIGHLVNQSSAPLACAHGG